MLRSALTYIPDRQRLTVLSPRRPAPPAGRDQAKLSRAAHPQPVFQPLAVPRNTWVIRGKDDTYLGFAFGDGRQAQQLNLSDYLPANRVPRLSNFVLDLTGILPDAIGIDLGGSAGISFASGMAGVNVLWHTRGEGNRARYPEVHVYYGYSGTLTLGSLLGSLSLGSFSAGTIFGSVSPPPSAAAAAQVLLAWARKYDEKRVGRPASNDWVANGFNWTGTFWSAGFAVPIPPRFTLVGSYYQSFPFRTQPKNTSAWLGVTFGIGVSKDFKIKTPFLKLDLSKLLDFKKLGLALNGSRTEYGLVYGNGNDSIPQRNNRDISGWHWPINQNNYPE